MARTMGDTVVLYRGVIIQKRMNGTITAQYVE